MANKTVQEVKNSLKFKAKPKSGVLSVRVGVKKYQVPVEVRMLSGDTHMFLSFPSVSELFRIDGKRLIMMDAEEDATLAYEALNPSAKKGRKRSRELELPSALAAALREVPDGFKIGYGSDGSPKLVRKRNRTQQVEREKVSGAVLI